MSKLLRLAYFAMVVKPVVLIVLGLNIRHRDRLPMRGPAIMVANHNSHLDAMVLMSLYPLRLLPRVRPVAAADYFFRNRVLKWFALEIVGIIPLQRDVKGMREDPLGPVAEAIDRGDIVVLFPEGRRGEPEQFKEFKNGIAHLARRHLGVPIVPVYLHGAGKALPRGEALLVPFIIDGFVGEALEWKGSKEAFMADLHTRMSALVDEGHFPPWE